MTVYREKVICYVVRDGRLLVFRFDDFLRTGAAQIVQPNVVRVGGITPFLGITAIAAEYGAAVHPHLLPELSGQLALTLPAGTSTDRRSGWQNRLT